MIDTEALTAVISRHMSESSRKQFFSIGDCKKCMEEVMEVINRKPFSEAIVNEEEQNLDDPHFDGKNFDPELDQKRLARLHFKVFAFMADEQWHLLSEISKATNVPEASASAKFRDFRKARWGSHTVLAERVGKTSDEQSRGLWRYKLIPNKESLTFKYYLDQIQSSQ